MGKEKGDARGEGRERGGRRKGGRRTGKDWSHVSKFLKTSQGQRYSQLMLGIQYHTGAETVFI